MNQAGANVPARSPWPRRRYYVAGDGWIRPILGEPVESYDLAAAVNARVLLAFRRWDWPPTSRSGRWDWPPTSRTSHDITRTPEPVGPMALDYAIASTIIPEDSGDRGEGGPIASLISLDLQDRSAIELHTTRYGLLGLDDAEGVGADRCEPLVSFRRAVEEFQDTCRAAALWEADHEAPERTTLEAALQKYIPRASVVPVYVAESDVPWQHVVGLPNPLVACHWGLNTLLQEGRPPRICANEKCRRLFLPVRTSKTFCSDRCANSTRVREKRRQKKEG